MQLNLMDNVALPASGAVFSSDRQYRYLLVRQVAEGLEGRCLFVMLQASTAGEVKNDPTIRRDISFTKAWGFGFFEVVNLFAFCSPDPSTLRNTPDPVGPENDQYILEAASRTDKIIVAWGDHGLFQERGAMVCALLEQYTLFCLGVNKSGMPRHPLYVPHNQELRVYATAVKEE